MSEVAQVLSAIRQGDALASERLLPLVYNEQRALAAQMMARGLAVRSRAKSRKRALRQCASDRAATVRER